MPSAFLHTNTLVHKGPIEAVDVKVNRHIEPVEG